MQCEKKKKEKKKPAGSRAGGGARGHTRHLPSGPPPPGVQDCRLSLNPAVRGGSPRAAGRDPLHPAARTRVALAAHARRARARAAGPHAPPRSVLGAVASPEKKSMWMERRPLNGVRGAGFRYALRPPRRGALSVPAAARRPCAGLFLPPPPRALRAPPRAGPPSLPSPPFSLASLPYAVARPVSVPAQLPTSPPKQNHRDPRKSFFTGAPQYKRQYHAA